jgi:dipeptidyl aminopeptidase/acylaminoacyl peptidase
MNRARVSPLLLGVGLLAIGFFVGYGFQSRASQVQRFQPRPSPKPALPTSPPLVKGLHSSPDGALLAFTGVWDRSSRAGVWLFDLRSGRARLTPSPLGWQDFVSQWRSDGRAVLVEREKIPRAAAEAKAGLFQTPVDRATLLSGEPQNVTPPLPSGEKLVSGTFAPDGTFLLKTRREPKSLFLASGEQARLLDRSPNSYGQNRAVKQNGHLVVYAVRDAPNSSGVALFRVQNGRSSMLTPPLADVSWSYVSPSAKWLVVAREDSESGDFVWTLYKIEATRARELRSQTVPADAISVYWSPGEKQILGASGQKLWNVSVPDLKVRQIGAKSNWNADDATWIGNQNAVAVAAGGELWRVDVASGQAKSVWKFPAPFWD